MFDISQDSLGVFTSFHETYQIMLDNLNRKEKLQFVAELDDEIVGCIIGAKEDTSTLFLPVIAVDGRHRKLGIARQLLDTLKKSKYKTIKVISSEEFAGFFSKLNFSPYLYVEPLEAVTTEQIKSLGATLQQVEEGSNYVKFALPEFKEDYAKPFKKRLRLVNTYLTFEKNIVE